MVRIETTVRDSNSPADPFADPFGGCPGAPAKSIWRNVREQQTAYWQAGDIPHESFFDKHGMKWHFRSDSSVLSDASASR